MALKRQLEKKLSIPEGVQVSVEPIQVVVKGKEGEVKIPVRSKILIIKVEDNNVVISPKNKQTKKEKAMINMINSLIRNAIRGVQDKYEYKLKVCSSHFPMSVKVNGQVLEISNFMGEKVVRKVALKEEADVKLEGEVITVKSCDKSLAGQVVSDIEKSTKRPAFDRRVFMDGIYLIEKEGVSLE